jgi:transcriptional regulator with XRE-family HTH domain
VDPPAAAPDPARVSTAGGPGGPLAWRFGAAIAQKRRVLGISQEELAHRADVHRTYLAGVERGRRNPSLLAITGIAAGLGITVSELFRLAEATEEPAPRPGPSGS